ARPPRARRGAGSTRGSASGCRRWRPSCRRLDEIAHTAHGVDERRKPVALDLLAQVGDVDLDDARTTLDVVAPDAIEDLQLADDAPRVAHQIAQQLELLRGELDAATRAGDLVALLVERQIAHPQHGVGV